MTFSFLNCELEIVFATRLKDSCNHIGKTVVCNLVESFGKLIVSNWESVINLIEIITGLNISASCAQRFFTRKISLLLLEKVSR